MATLAVAITLGGAAPAIACTELGPASINCRRSAPPKPREAGSASTTSPDRLASLLNAYRARSGLPALRMDRRAAAVARTHALRMAAEGKVFHNTWIASAAGRRKLGSPARLAENVGAAHGVRALHDALVRSPRHRANILGRFSSVGVAVAERDGLVYGVQVFLSRSGAAAARPAPAAGPAAGVSGDDAGAHRPAVVPRMVEALDLEGIESAASGQPLGRAAIPAAAIALIVGTGLRRRRVARSVI